MENYETITVLFKRSGMDPEIKQIEPSADAIRSLVGGPFEASHIYVGRKQFAFYCHQEGKLEGFASNFLNFANGRLYDIVVGPVVFFRRDGENEASLSDSDIDVLRTWLSKCSL